MDGRFTYSGVIKVTLPELAEEFSIAPNPVSDLLKISFSNRQIENTLIQVVDLSGRTLKQQIFVTVTGANQNNY